MRNLTHLEELGVERESPVKVLDTFGLFQLHTHQPSLVEGL